MIKNCKQKRLIISPSISRVNRKLMNFHRFGIASALCVLRAWYQIRKSLKNVGNLAPLLVIPVQTADHVQVGGHLGSAVVLWDVTLQSVKCWKLTTRPHGPKNEVSNFTSMSTSTLNIITIWRSTNSVLGSSVSNTDRLFYSNKISRSISSGDCIMYWAPHFTWVLCLKYQRNFNFKILRSFQVEVNNTDINNLHND